MGNIETASADPKPPRRPLPFKPGRTEAVCNTLWPLASECWMDWTHAKGANFYHFRMGPFYGDAAHEIDWEAFGGPYAGGPGSDWNPAFWAKYRDLLAHARSIGANVEVNVIDTWYCKHAQWGDQPMPWPAEDIDACGRRPSPEQEKYIRKVVAESCAAPHVVWITDNEGDQIQGDTPAWYEWVRTTIRDAEQQCPTPTVRMIGTNSPTLTNLPFDYFATHARQPLTAPFGGRHSENNERNPDLGSPEAEHAAFCAARAEGLHWWYWRAEQSTADMTRTLDLFGSGCGGSVGCFPPPDDGNWVDLGPGPGSRTDEVHAGQALLGSLCKEPRQYQNGVDAIRALSVKLREQGYCAGPVGSPDHVMFQSESDQRLWEEHHACSPFDSGCWATGGEFYPKKLWRYTGPWTQPQPPSCQQDVPTVDQIACKEHQATNHIYDCTPKANGQPILPEGDPNRAACELKAMGGQWPVYSVSGGALTVAPRENPMQFQLKGTGSGVVSCVVPVGTFCDLSVSQ